MIVTNLVYDIHLLRFLEMQNNLPCFPIFCFFSTTFPGYRGMQSKNIFYRPSNTIQLFVAVKRNFSGLFFFRKSRSEGEFLINVAACLIAQH